VFLTLANEARRVPRAPIANRDPARILFDAVRRDQIRLCGLGTLHGRGAVRIASELMAAEDRLTQTDALIVATALACEECKVLYTDDAALLESRELVRVARSRHVTLGEAPS
jgi:predicted nucleic acid-binding protein